MTYLFQNIVIEKGHLKSSFFVQKDNVKKSCKIQFILKLVKQWNQSNKLVYISPSFIKMFEWEKQW